MKAGTIFESRRKSEPFHVYNDVGSPKDLLVANLDSLNRLLGAGEPADTERAAEQIAGADAWDWGPMLVTATLWRELGLEQILDRLGGRGKRDGVALSERALVLVANRLCAPSSEHGLARWLETDFVCDRQGRGGCRGGTMMGNGERVAPRGFAWSFANSSSGTERSTSCMPAKNRSRRSCFCACGICFRLRLTWCFTT